MLYALPSGNLRRRVTEGHVLASYAAVEALAHAWPVPDVETHTDAPGGGSNRLAGFTSSPSAVDGQAGAEPSQPPRGGINVDGWLFTVDAATREAFAQAEAVKIGHQVALNR